MRVGSLVRRLTAVRFSSGASAPSAASKLAEDRKIPTAPLVLGFSGLVPFFAGAAASTVDQYRDRAVELERAYAAVILSFLGAVHWGLALRSRESSAAMYVFSVAPSLVAWGSTLLEPNLAYPTLTLAFLGLQFLEFKVLPQMAVPRWYLRLRVPLNALATLSLMVTYYFSAKAQQRESKVESKALQ